MQVLSLHPGVDLARVQKATSFELERGETLSVTPAPTEAELCILREEVDPHRYIIGR
jgi:glutaconate CoA-transferase subunit B